MPMRRYDAWRLAGFDEEHEVGTEPGDPCERYPEPDGDEPRGYRSKPCTGYMESDYGGTYADITCNVCGEVAE
jgi:hypothetical protein